LEQSLRKKTELGIIWVLSQRIGAKLISFVVTIFLARVLSPSEFGLVALVSVFNDILHLFIKGSLGEAIIRKRTVDEYDYSTAFIFNFAISILCYSWLFLCSNWIADFFLDPQLATLLQVAGLNLIISSFSFAQVSRLTREMNFKIQTLATLIGIIAGAVTGVSMALNGFGVWALIGHSIVMNLCTTVSLNWLSKWKPVLVFSWSRFKELWSFSYKLLLSGILNAFMVNLYALMIGRFYPAAQVGLYNRANALRDLYINNVINTIQHVSYPALASIENENDRLLNSYRQVLSYTMYATLPLMVLGILVSHDLFVVLYGSKWLAAVPYFKLVCVIGALYPLHTINLNILKVKSRSDLYLKLEVLKVILILVGLWFTRSYGVSMILLGQVVISVVALALNSYYSGLLINYSLLKQFRDLLPVTLISAASAFFTFIVQINILINNSMLAFLAHCIVFLLVFVGISWLTKQAPILYLFSKLKRLRP
jgi:teichuronic acid exporter